MCVGACLCVKLDFHFFCMEIVLFIVLFLPREFWVSCFLVDSWFSVKVLTNASFSVLLNIVVNCVSGCFKLG